MTVDILDIGTILVTMCESDMRDYSIDFSADADSGEITRGLTALLYRLGEICGPELPGKSWLIEALPAKDGCMLIISVRRVPRRKRYRVKRDSTCPVCEFFDTDSMLDFLGSNTGRIACFTVYSYNDKFILIPELYSCEGALRELSEYGALRRVSRVASARIEEFGRAITQHRSPRHLT